MRHLLLLILSVSTLLSAQEQAAKSPKRFGHSGHGPAYDEGPRQRPWEIEGIGEAPFTITTRHPKVQKWFNQGNALLHSFWDYEAERAFRWCVTLDPDCAMAYWALAITTSYAPERARVFLQTALDKIEHVETARERRIIRAWAKVFLPSLERAKPGKPGSFLTSVELADELEKLLVEFPDDIEIKLRYVHNSLELPDNYDKDRGMREAVLQQVLAKHPKHPAAHHYRIHNWDSIELGHVALDSCAQYGRIAPDIGHANHMPGHIYTKLGMWHEGAIWLDAATRVEKAYLRKRMVLPHAAWNYSHNRNFLAHAQSMLGLPSAALQGAYDLLNAPIDPKYNKTDGGESTFREGLDALRRTLVRFERWDELLDADRVPWPDTPTDRMWRAYAQAMARIGRLELRKAEIELVALREVVSQLAEEEETDDEEAEAHADRRLHAIMVKEVEGRLWLKRNDSMRGLRALQEAAELEYTMREADNDPPMYPRCLYNVLGEAYLELDSPRLAVAAFEKALVLLRNNGFSWAGLAQAHHALGAKDKARHAYARLLHVWSGAEPGIRQLEAARALGLQAEPADDSPARQRNYSEEILKPLGPNLWQPYPAPALLAKDADGREVRLKDYRGKNVLLVFYLSDQCLHCVEQLRAIARQIREFERRDTVVLAISADPPTKNKQSDVGSLPFIVLSDSPNHANARRYKSFDDFEKMELHSTQIIDRRGRLRWVRSGGDPFSDIEFLLGELDRIEKIEKQGRLGLSGMIQHASGKQR